MPRSSLVPGTCTLPINVKSHLLNVLCKNCIRYLSIITRKNNKNMFHERVVSSYYVINARECEFVAHIRCERYNMPVRAIESKANP